MIENGVKMESLKQIIAKNICDLRKENKITQLELAEKLHYSDKAVSKWERAESLPEITVLKEIADMFKVNVDYLLEPEHKANDAPCKEIDKRNKRNRTLITCISIMLVWFVATLAFVNVDIIFQTTFIHYVFFIYSVPASIIIWLVFNTLWFNKRLNFFIISILIWAVLFAIFLTIMFTLNFNIWLIFLIGIPGQIIILLWAGIKTK